MSTTKKGKSATRRFTDFERKAFLEILRRHRTVIENKKSDAVSLSQKETAWREIADEYNSLKDISTNREICQLKKLWTNAKYCQRNVLTKCKKERMKTGGGPEEPIPDIDPDVAVIAPHLMVTTPSIFSSNMTDTEVEDISESLLDGRVDINRPSVEQRGPYKEYTVTFSQGNDSQANDSQANDSQVNDAQSQFDIAEMPVIICETATDDPDEPDEINTSRNDVASTVNSDPVHDVANETPQRRPDSAVSRLQKKKRSSLPNMGEEQSLKIRRINELREQESRLSSMRYQMEQRIYDVRVQHLMEQHDVQMDIFQEQLREAKAKADLAVLLLQKNQESS